MTLHVPIENKTKILSEWVYRIVGLQILQIVLLLMYFFKGEVMQTYLKMVASLGESAAISCQEGSLVRNCKWNGTEILYVCKGGTESKYFPERCQG